MIASAKMTTLAASPILAHAPLLKVSKMTDIQKLKRIIRNAQRRKRLMDYEERCALSEVKAQLAALLKVQRLDRISARRFGEP